MLHVASSGCIAPGDVARAVRLVRTTSPSALLLASLDAPRRQLAAHGEALVERTLQVAASTRASVAAVAGCALIGAELVGRPGVAAWDPLRLVIDVRGTGVTGYEIATALRVSYDIHLELATQATLVLVLGLDQPLGPLERFAHDFAETVRRVARPSETGEAISRPLAALRNEVVVSPRDAFLGGHETVPAAAAVGRVSAEAIAGYPPGIPALLPGERITGEVLAYLRGLVDAGARLHGASDPDVRSLDVLAA